MSTNVVKRNGSVESLNLEKIHKMVEMACDGVAGVSESAIEMNANLQIFDGIKTDDIQEILIKSANDLISLDTPNYQFVAARLLLFSLRKAVYNAHPDSHPHLYSHIKDCIGHGLYDPALLDSYSEEEWDEINSMVDYDRDYMFTYAGLRQVVDKYLVQDRSSNEVYETPQQMYVMIAATLFQRYPQESRLTYVKKYYDAISRHKINIPTPIMGGVRTPLRQFASCVLVDIDDTLDSIFSSDMAYWLLRCSKGNGIGINAGRIRGINSKIRGGEVQHTGVVPFLKKFESTVRCCTQNGIRGGSATVHFPIWHQEIEDILVLKNNKGTEDNRVRKLDYSIQLSELFYKRFISSGNITLFSPHDTPGLYDAFGTDKFDDLYTRYESDESIPKTVVPAQDLILAMLKERAETGRIYLMNIDHCNTHSSFKDKVNMSNLCQEITLPTDPIQSLQGQGEIALCILSAINVGKITKTSELENLCDLAVRGLEELIDYQEYPVKAAEDSTIARRSLGIGYIGLAHYLAKQGVKYNDQGAYDLVHELTESFQYYLLKASNQLSKERGPCGNFSVTKYHDGILPIDTYKKDVDNITSVAYQHDWNSLRDDIQKFGLRHSTLSAQMPSESNPLCQTQPMESSHLETTCPLRNRRKGLLSRLFRNTTH